MTESWNDIFSKTNVKETAVRKALGRNWSDYVGGIGWGQLIMGAVGQEEISVEQSGILFWSVLTRELNGVLALGVGSS